MILFTRLLARDVRAVFARCVAGRPRGPAPPVVVRVVKGVRTVAATTPEGVTLAHTTPAPKEPDDLVVLPAAVLASVEGSTDEAVTLDCGTKLRGVVRATGAKPPEAGVELILPGKQHELSDPPSLAPASATLLAALHECGRAAARENGRFALSKVQLQGKAGRVVGTDGKVALLWAGFRFPFADDVLVPAVPAFGSKPLAREADVRVGRAQTHLVVAAGPWSVWLPTDARAKYPDVAAVVPRHAPTSVEIAEADAAEVLRELPGLPGADHELRPVTLDAGPTVRVRGWAADESGAREVTLLRSAATGPASSAVLDRRTLARALALGCRTLRLTPGKPVAGEGGGVTLVAAQLDPGLAAPAANDDPPPTRLPHPEHERSGAMKPHESNGHVPSGRHDPPAETIDPLAAAEELRAALGEALARAGRLVAALKAGRKERRALASVYSSLKQLNLEQP